MPAADLAGASEKQGIDRADLFTVARQRCTVVYRVTKSATVDGILSRANLTPARPFYYFLAKLQYNKSRIQAMRGAD